MRCFLLFEPIKTGEKVSPKFSSSEWWGEGHGEWYNEGELYREGDGDGQGDGTGDSSGSKSSPPKDWVSPSFSFWFAVLRTYL